MESRNLKTDEFRNSPIESYSDDFFISMWQVLFPPLNFHFFIFKCFHTNQFIKTESFI